MSPASTTSSVGPQIKMPSVAVRVAGPTRIEPGLANDWIAAASPTTVPMAPYSKFVPAPIGQGPPARSRCLSAWPAHSRPSAVRPLTGRGTRPGPPLGVVLVGLGSSEDGLKATPRDRGDYSSEAFYLCDHPRQHFAYSPRMSSGSLFLAFAIVATSANSTLTVLRLPGTAVPTWRRAMLGKAGPWRRCDAPSAVAAAGAGLAPA